VSEGVFAHWPNRITAMRFVGAAVLFALLSLAHSAGETGAWFHPVAFWLFVLTAATDFVDGWLARRENQVTAFGRIADPFVDKVLVLGTMIFLVVMEFSRDFFPAWIVVVVLAREFLVTGIRGYVESLGREFPADWFGKIKMVVQCVAIGAVLGLDAFPWSEGLRSAVVVLAHVAVWATLLTSVGSGLSYVLKTRAILRGAAA
jgi:CDP-diacylglycerol--glycerol-3-phosphate 3-phosphatidyltransferase